MIKKFSTILLTLLLLVTNITFVLAENEEETTNDNEPISDNSNTIDNTESDTENRLSDLNNKVNKQETEITIIKNQVSEIESRSTGTNGNYTNFERLTTQSLEFYYNNYSLLGFFYKNNNNELYFAYITDFSYCRWQEENNRYNFYYTKYYKYYLDTNQVVEFTSGSFNYYPNNVSDNYNGGFYLFRNGNDIIFSLTPYKLTINNGENVSINPNSAPYDSNIFYGGQSITLTYDDQNNDFTGWYNSSNGELISNHSQYTFTISSDTNITPNYYQSNIDYSHYFIYIIMILSFIFLNDITKGILN